MISKGIHSLETSPVVFYREPGFLRRRHQTDGDAPGLRVTGDVAQSFLTDAVQGYLDARRQRPSATDDIEGRFNSLPRPPLQDQSFERLGQGTLLQRGGPEVEHGAPGFFEVWSG